MIDFKKKQNLTVQSLRGIAVLGVILCHYQIPIFKGGYLGVDIFCYFRICNNKNDY